MALRPSSDRPRTTRQLTFDVAVLIKTPTQIENRRGKRTDASPQQTPRQGLTKSHHRTQKFRFASNHQPPSTAPATNHQSRAPSAHPPAPAQPPAPSHQPPVTSPRSASAHGP